MVFRMVRRSGLLYRIVSSLAAVCFDCLLEVVWLATNTARLGFATMVRNHDSLAATDPERTSLATRRRGSGHLPISDPANHVTARARHGCPGCSSATLETRGRWTDAFRTSQPTKMMVCSMHLKSRN